MRPGLAEPAVDTRAVAALAAADRQAAVAASASALELEQPQALATVVELLAVAIAQPEQRQELAEPSALAGIPGQQEQQPWGTLAQLAEAFGSLAQQGQRRGTHRSREHPEQRPA